MAGRSSIRCLDRCTKQAECVVKEIKTRIHTSRTFSTTRNASDQSISRTQTIQALKPRTNLPWRATSTSVIQRRYASGSEKELQKTPLYDLHVSKKAKFVPFGGYSMPLYYDDLSHVESHHWTREKASIFDVSHMYGALPLS